MPGLMAETRQDAGHCLHTFDEMIDFHAGCSC